MDNKHLHSLHGGRFTAETLLAYRRGTLGDAERRRLERAMEEDAFLRDAVEGLSLAEADTVERILAELNRDVDVITGQKRAFRISATAKKYAAAAMILAFFGVTLLIMNRLNRDAAQQQLAMEKSPTYPSLSNADTGDMGSGTLRDEAVVKEDKSSAPPATIRIEESVAEQEEMPAEGLAVAPVAGDAATYDEDFRTDAAVTTQGNSGVGVLAPEKIESVESDSEYKSTSLSEVTIATKETVKDRKKQKADEAKQVTPSVAKDDVAGNAYVTDSVYTTLPEYPGGQAAIDIYLTKNLLYPADTPNGTAYAELTISAGGKVKKAIIVRSSLNAAADKEIIRVLEKMPDWKPGTVNGRATEMQVIIPVVKESN